VFLDSNCVLRHRAEEEGVQGLYHAKRIRHLRVMSLSFCYFLLDVSGKDWDVQGDRKRRHVPGKWRICTKGICRYSVLQLTDHVLSDHVVSLPAEGCLSLTLACLPACSWSTLPKTWAASRRAGTARGQATPSKRTSKGPSSILAHHSASEMPTHPLSIR
jgi:hypothetical protein